MIRLWGEIYTAALRFHRKEEIFMPKSNFGRFKDGVQISGIDLNLHQKGKVFYVHLLLVKVHILLPLNHILMHMNRIFQLFLQLL